MTGALALSNCLPGELEDSWFVEEMNGLRSHGTVFLFVEVLGFCGEEMFRNELSSSTCPFRSFGLGKFGAGLYTFQTQTQIPLSGLALQNPDYETREHCRLPPPPVYPAGTQIARLPLYCAHKNRSFVLPSVFNDFYPHGLGKARDTWDLADFHSLH